MKMHKENTVILNFTSTSSIAAFSHSKSILNACAKRLPTTPTRKLVLEIFHQNKINILKSSSLKTNRIKSKENVLHRLLRFNLFRFK